MYEEHDSVSIVEWLRWVLAPITYTFLVALPFLLSDPHSPPILWVFAGALYGACLIRLIVLWINRRDDSGSAEPPPENF